MTTPIEGTTPRTEAGRDLLKRGERWVLGDDPGIPVNLPGLRRAIIAIEDEGCDRLRAIEAAARTLMAGSVVPVADGRAVVETDRLIALREALR